MPQFSQNTITITSVPRKQRLVTFAVLTAVFTQMQVLWNASPCRLLHSSTVLLGGRSTSIFNVKNPFGLFYREDRRTTLLLKVRAFLP